MKNLLNIALSLSLATIGYPVYAESSTSYQAAVLADCSELDNCPLTKGDTLLTSDTARSGLPLRDAVLILGLNTQVKIVNLNNELKEFNLIKGTLSLNILKNQPRHVYQIDAGKLLKVFIREAGYYRIEVSPNQRETSVRVIKGSAEIRIGNVIRVIKQGQTANIKQTDNKPPIYTNVQGPNGPNVQPIISLNGYSKPITGTTSTVNPQAIPDATPDTEIKSKTIPNDVSEATTRATPESSIKVIEKPSEQLLSTPVTQPQIDRQPGVRSAPLILPETRPQPTRNEGIRLDPTIKTDAKTSKEIIPDAELKKNTH